MEENKPEVSGQPDILNALAYPIPIIVSVILIVTKKEDPEARYHAYNSLFFWLAVCIVQVALMVISAVIGPLACITGIVSVLVGLGSFIYSILLLIQVYNGQKPVIPVVTDFAKKYM